MRPIRESARIDMVLAATVLVIGLWALLAVASLARASAGGEVSADAARLAAIGRRVQAYQDSGAALYAATETEAHGDALHDRVTFVRSCLIGHGKDLLAWYRNVDDDALYLYARHGGPVSDPGGARWKAGALALRAQVLKLQTQATMYREQVKRLQAAR